MMGIVQCRYLGHKGRFGNAIHQFVACNSYAEFVNCFFSFNKDWNGLKIFDVCINYKDVEFGLRNVNEHELIMGTENINLDGFFQNIKFYKIMYLNKIKTWLKIKDKWLNKFPKKKDFYIACHLRRGDMVEYSTSYPVFTEQSYINAVRKFGFNDNDVIWVSENDPILDDECNSLGIPFLPDFMTLYHSDVLFRANSTFSFWAGVLGGCIMYSPIHDFPGFNSMIGLIDVDFEYGLGPDKEGIISK